MFGIEQKGANAAKQQAKLHSMAAVLRGRSFEGSFVAGDVTCRFSYRPTKAALAARKLELTGDLTVTDGRLNAAPHNLANVKATLISAQGGIGTAPPRKQSPPDIYASRPELPVVESTGSLSFCGALYFKLAPLQGGALGVSADMSNLQLNVRLAPRNDAEREQQSAYSSIVDALLGKKVDSEGATAAVADLNKLLASG